MRFAVLAWTPDYAFFTHRVHHVMLGGFLVLLTASVAAQLYRPAERVGAFLFAALAVGTLTVVSVIVEGLADLGEMAIFIAPLVVLGLLHPGLRSVSVCDRVDRRMFALAAVAAVPLVAFAAIQTKLQLTMVDDHVIFGHYTFMAAGALTIGLGALIGSLRPAGRLAGPRLRYRGVTRIGRCRFGPVPRPGPGCELRPRRWAAGGGLGDQLRCCRRTREPLRW